MASLDDILSRCTKFIEYKNDLDAAERKAKQCDEQKVSDPPPDDADEDTRVGDKGGKFNRFVTVDEQLGDDGVCDPKTIVEKLRKIRESKKFTRYFFTN